MRNYDLVWAKSGSWPFWPAIIQPSSKSKKSSPSLHKVLFIEKNPQHDLVSSVNLVPFDTDEKGLRYSSPALKWAVEKAGILARSSVAEKMKYVSSHRLPASKRGVKKVVGPLPYSKCRVILTKYSNEGEGTISLEEEEGSSNVSSDDEDMMTVDLSEEAVANDREAFLKYLSEDEDEDKENAFGRREKKKTTLSSIIVGRKNRDPLMPLSRHCPLNPRTVESPLFKEELSDYEKLRLKNIQEREAIFKSLKTEVNHLKKGLLADKKSNKTPRRLSFPNSYRKEPILTRGKAKSPQFKDLNSLKNDESYLKEYIPRKRMSAPSMWGFNPNIDILHPEDVTQEMLEGVCERVSEKVYCHTNGTTCHQCRQKTTDMKTACRSGECRGARGMFCGICLKNRYGESIRDALLNPDWKCPPCRDICNCSICRSRVGKCPTGNLTDFVQSKGFSSVKDYLVML